MYATRAACSPSARSPTPATALASACEWFAELARRARAPAARVHRDVVLVRLEQLGVVVRVELDRERARHAVVAEARALVAERVGRGALHDEREAVRARARQCVLTSSITEQRRLAPEMRKRNVVSEALAHLLLARGYHAAPARRGAPAVSRSAGPQRSRGVCSRCSYGRMRM